MEFVRGSHQSQHRHLIKISDESEDLYSRLVAEEQLPVEPTGPMAVGDVSFHASRALHRAMGNSTPEVREVTAPDLAVVWMLLPSADHERFWAAYAATAEHESGDDLRIRTKGWALALSLVFLAHSADNPLIAGIGRRTLDAVLAQAAFSDQPRSRGDHRP